MILKRRIQIKNPQGLHARPASLFVKIANKFESDVTVKKGSESVKRQIDHGPYDPGRQLGLGN